jgi:iron complex transport system substrate-binding protein
VPQPAERPERVVSIAPNVTETVFALGQGDRLVGVTPYCDYPPETAHLPKVGGHIDPDFERIIALRPDLIMVQGNHEKVAAFAEQNGIPLAHVQMNTLTGIYEGISTIGSALRVRPKAEALRARVGQQIEDVRRAVAGRPRPTVLIITGREAHDLSKLNTTGGTSFVSELVKTAGGQNIYEDETERYFEASKETVVVQAPEVIIEFHAGEILSERDRQEFVSDWQQLPSLPAVKNGRIYLVTESYALRPGPRVPLVARQLARLLHPNADIPEP